MGALPPLHAWRLLPCAGAGTRRGLARVLSAAQRALAALRRTCWGRTTTAGALIAQGRPPAGRWLLKAELATLPRVRAAIF